MASDWCGRGGSSKAGAARPWGSCPHYAASRNYPARWTPFAGVRPTVATVPGVAICAIKRHRPRRRRGCTGCLPCWERIWERNATQLPRWGETRRDGWDGRSIVTCADETDRATGDGDRLAHNPEVMARARWAGQGGALCCWSLFMLGVLRARSPCGRPSLFSSNVALVLADSCCCSG
jgi:hypothetical protein